MTDQILHLKQNAQLQSRRRAVIEAIGWQAKTSSHPWSPPTDLFETASAYIVRLEVAGMRQQDFHISLQGGFLTIQGMRQNSPERCAYHQMEVRFGEFSSIVAIPGAIRTEESLAEYEDGFLTVTLPKKLPETVHIR